MESKGNIQGRFEGFGQRISHFFKRYQPGLAITLIALPGIMIAATFICYMGYAHEYTHPASPSHPSTIMGSIMSVSLGVVGGFLGWLILAMGAQTFAAIDRANPALYRELRARFEALQSHIQAARESKGISQLPDDQNGGATARWHQRRISALEEMDQYNRRLQEAFGEKSPPDRDFAVRDWLQGYGYVNLLAQLHRLEELLILFLPVEILLTDAWQDGLRLRGSPIENRDVLSARLGVAERSLSARYHLYGEPPRSESLSPVSQVLMDEFSARETMLCVRRLLNEFRDERRTGLVRARNQLLTTITLTTFVIFALLAAAVLVEVSALRLVEGTLLFLVGAVIGLFSRLALDIGARISTEDFGLATARLVHTPLVSGLAALGGVLIIPLLARVASSTPTGSLGDIFNMSQTPFGIVLAAIFGVSPAALISRLQQEAEQYKTDLKSTGATTSGPTAL
jgi:hypothetical protein